MPGWVWVLIAIAVVVVLGVVVWQALARRRTERLRDRFGPEYDRTIGTAENRREAESDLAAREERRDRLEIRPLSQAARDRYVQSWQAVQAQFVDDPSVAVASADSLIQSVMAERGYPVEDFEQRAADVSVDHPQVVENYRDGHRLAEESANGDGSTESLRQAMRHYRALFEELVEADADQPLQREQSEDVPDAPDSAERQVR
jgi:cytoskeletal protein RodZ